MFWRELGQTKLDVKLMNDLEKFDFEAPSPIQNGTVAGTHIIADLWDCVSLSDIRYAEDRLYVAVRVSGATLLQLRSHAFDHGGGFTSFAMLAESHISLHSWPERNLLAVDVFMCGATRPYAALDSLIEGFKPSRINASEHMRGILLW